MTEPIDAMSFADLPTDILLSIVQYLNPLDLLSLCSTTRLFQYDPELRYSPAYWRYAIKNTFRVPNQPVVAGDGRRWMRLYKKMRTQTKIYGWGSNEHAVFGEQPQVLYRDTAQVLGPHARARVSRVTLSTSKSSVQPVEIERGHATIIADLQCGGWSTTMLDSKGLLYTMGTLDALYHSAYRSTRRLGRTRLMFPHQSQEEDEPYKYEPRTAIKQFSSGRRHVLGVSDSGRIWSWHAVGSPGVQIKFLTIDLVESSNNSESQSSGTVRQVVAGWDKSSTYVVGTGIVTWTPSNDAEQHGAADQSEIDAIVVFEPKIVPESGYLRSTTIYNASPSASSENLKSVGEVTNYILLANWVVFVTDLGKVFTSNISDNEGEPQRTIQVLPVSSDLGPAPPDAFALDVHGSYKSFAIIKRSGEVLLADLAYLEALWLLPHDLLHSAESRPKFRKLPCLQHTGVISMAFGDYHSHALHADGTISSYGHEPKSDGALGLGPNGYETDFLRGLKRIPNSPDRDFMPQCFTSGRRIAFEEEKRLWLKHMGEDSSEGAIQCRRLCTQRPDVKAEVSEWVEQKLNGWSKPWTNPDNNHSEDDSDDLPAYFALSVAAAGWHSGALVLVDEEKERMVRNSHKIQRATARSSTPRSSIDRQEAADAAARSDDETIQREESLLTSSVAVVGSTATTLANLALDTISSGVRSFLGLPDYVAWNWAREGFPRLRLRSGEIMPGTGPVVDWTGPQEWEEVKWVVE